MISITSHLVVSPLVPHIRLEQISAVGCAFASAHSKGSVPV
jgi:hypothetical protein